MTKAISIFGAVLLIALIACSSQAEPTHTTEPTEITQGNPTTTQTTPAATQAKAVNPTTTPTAIPQTVPQPTPEQAAATPIPNTTPAQPQATPQLTQTKPTTQPQQTAEPTPQPTATSQPATASAPQPTQCGDFDYPSQVYEACPHILQDLAATHAGQHLTPLKGDQPQDTERYSLAELHEQLNWGPAEQHRYKQYQTISAQTCEHPHLKAFPLTAYACANDIAKINPHFETETDGASSPYWRSHRPFFRGPETFLRTLWSMPIVASAFYKERPGATGSGYNNQLDFGPRHFGKDSVMQVLADGITKAIADHAHNLGATIPAYNLPETAHGYTLHPKAVDRPEQPWQNALTTPILFDDIDNAITVDLIKWTEREEYRFLAPPMVNWELVHDQLPIVQVTAWGELPLQTKQGEKVSSTKYVLSFIAAFKETWERDSGNRLARQLPAGSFETQAGQWYYPMDGNRPLTNQRRSPSPDNYANRFTAEYGADQNGNTPFAEYLAENWHFTDYSVHSIVGPVTLTIVDSPVIEPGDYQVQLSKTTWANSCAKTPESALRPDRNHTYHFKREEIETWDEFPDKVANFLTPNTLNIGFPLPGGYVANATTLNIPGLGDQAEVQAYLESCNR